MSFWDLFVIFAVALVGGMIISAISLIIGGAGSLRVLSRRLGAVEDGIEALSDRLTSEVRRRVSAKGNDARKSAQSDTEVVEAAREYLRTQGDGATPPPGSKSPKKPSVITGR